MQQRSNGKHSQECQRYRAQRHVASSHRDARVQREPRHHGEHHVHRQRDQQLPRHLLIQNLIQNPIQNPGGQGRIRTSVARKERQIYSLLPLTTRPPVHRLRSPAAPARESPPRPAERKKTEREEPCFSVPTFFLPHTSTQPPPPSETTRGSVFPS